MADELPAETGGAPEPTQTPETGADYEKRWKETHTWGNSLNEQLSSLKSDPNALITFLREHHPELVEEDEADEEPELEPDEAERPLTRAEFEEWKREQAQETQARTNAQKYEDDLKAFVNGRELSPLGERAIRAAQVKSPDELKAAVDEWFEFEADRKPPARKQNPTPPQPGKAGEPKYDPRDRSARRARMAAAIEAANQD